MSRETIARAAATDAGNRAALAAGRGVWSEDDYAVAVAEYLRLMPPAALLAQRTSPARRHASRENGKRGGRPPKPPHAE